MLIISIASFTGSEREHVLSAQKAGGSCISTLSEVSYGNNMNICAAEVLVHNQPGLSSSLARTLLQSLLILDTSTVSSGAWDLLFSSVKDDGK